MKTTSKQAHYFPEPARGTRNPLADRYRYTICRLSDNKERFSNRRPSLRFPWRWLVWDNQRNEKA